MTHFSPAAAASAQGLHGPHCAQGPHGHFLLTHGLLVPLLLVLLASALPRLGADQALSSLFYNPATQHFWGQGSPWLELLGHRLAKSAVLVVWLLLLAAALVARWVPGLRQQQAVLWATVLAMGLGPVLVAGLKDINTHACPWDLQQYGGTAEFSARWFVSRAEAGRCFPGGHAAGGFSLVALAFASRVMGKPLLESVGWLLAAGAGLVFSLVRVSQGAHFLSHNLWSAAIVWALSALVFAPLLLAPPPGSPRQAGLGFGRRGVVR